MALYASSGVRATGRAEGTATADDEASSNYEEDRWADERHCCIYCLTIIISQQIKSPAIEQLGAVSSVASHRYRSSEKKF